MRTVFLDTVGLIAVWDKTDQWHEPASRVYHALLSEPVVVVTTTAILLECGNAAARKPFRSGVEDLRVRLEQGHMLIPVHDEDWHVAWAAYARGVQGSAGIVDQISFAVMRRLGLTQVFTNDQHFRAAGFETLF